MWCSITTLMVLKEGLEPSWLLTGGFWVHCVYHSATRAQPNFYFHIEHRTKILVPGERLELSRLITGGFWIHCVYHSATRAFRIVVRGTGFEPVTPAVWRQCSTAELAARSLVWEGELYATKLSCQIFFIKNLTLEDEVYRTYHTKCSPKII